MISRGEFPRQVQLGRRAVGWMAEDVLDWIHAKIDTSNEGDTQSIVIASGFDSP
jgi:predicted DNA-binding transcriptional regulator AlpA